MNAESNNREIAANAEAPATESPNPASVAVAAAQPAAAPPPPPLRIPWWIPASAVAVVALVIIFGIRSRVNAEASVTRATHEAAIPIVTVVHPVADAPAQEIADLTIVAFFASDPLPGVGQHEFVALFDYVTAIRYFVELLHTLRSRGPNARDRGAPGNGRGRACHRSSIS